ncbi:MAG TPA: hypothetical protein VNS19_01445 [Acidimicrobiales bacterium]|nr:hypothetical protein [Acidimicrobiales bacterium]
MPARKALHKKIDQLGAAEAAVVEQVVDSELIEIESSTLTESWLTSSIWAEAFSARLRAHHALNPEPLMTTAFEAAFNGACTVAGWKVDPTPSAVNRFYDTNVRTSDDVTRSISLKSSAAKDLKQNTVHISKLCEAAWIQDARTQKDRQRRLIKLFADLQKATDAILQLRCFRLTNAYRYELVEVPVSVFDHVAALTVAQAQPGTIWLPPKAKKAQDADARLRIDKSDGKLTVTGIRSDICTIHGEWKVRNMSGTPADKDKA